ncbi:N-6 DNA methylase [Paenisporosarcina sp. NPDC076898]|uniref:N-6 DNA methylase n=1 Tax=unclassified Paenisporosarcina TaxID=2642018 RepID=UPI003D068680
MSDITKKINELLGIDDSYKAPEALMKMLRDKDKREKVFMEFLQLFDFDVSYDWFHEYFQDEHADRKNKKQDFTPVSVARLLVELMNDPEIDNWTRYEPCAGTGGITIQAWQKDRMNHSPFDYKPSWYVYHCEELSDRCIPFLLFNCMIRGMNAIVVHCDVLSRKSKGCFFVQNEKDDHMMFSSLNVMPYTQEVADFLKVEWDDGIMYEPLVESEEFPRHLMSV